MCFWNEKTSSVFPKEFEENKILVFFIWNGQSSCWSYQILFPLECTERQEDEDKFLHRRE